MREALRNAHPAAQIIALVLIGLGSMFVCTMVLAGIHVALGGDFSDMGNMSRAMLGDHRAINLLKWMQVAQAVGLFVAPYLVYRFIIRQNTYDLTLDFRWSSAIAFSLIMVAAFPMVNALAEFNSNLRFPHWMDGLNQWISGTEANAERLIRLFLSMDSTLDLLINILIIGLLTAVGEELFFRGTIQPLLLKLFPNQHVAVWLTAFLFSFFHLQFLGFLPRFILGAMLGYSAHWSRSLMVPIAGHFTNNALAVVIAWFVGIDTLDERMETIGAEPGHWFIALLSTLIVAGSMLSFHRYTSRSKYSTLL
ncbi:MAG: hypothetical protein Kow0075_04070 [Salibacteraceae bacterium]